MFRNIFLLLPALLSAISLWGADLIKNGDFEKGTKHWQPYRGNWKEPFIKPAIVPCTDKSHGRFAASLRTSGGIRAAGTFRRPRISTHYQMPRQSQTVGAGLSVLFRP